jgi:hypothetical protein
MSLMSLMGRHSVVTFCATALLIHIVMEQSKRTPKQQKQDIVSLTKMVEDIQRIEQEYLEMGFPMTTVSREVLKNWFETWNYRMMMLNIAKLAATDPEAHLRASTTVMSYILPKAVDKSDEKNTIINIVAPSSFTPQSTSSSATSHATVSTPPIPTPDVLELPSAQDIDDMMIQ